LFNFQSFENTQKSIRSEKIRTSIFILIMKYRKIYIEN